jgi:hypothetical protein
MKRICPQCLKEYETILERPPYDERPIQEIYPNVPPWVREQLITGLCSNECWIEYIKFGEETEDQ